MGFVHDQKKIGQPGQIFKKKDGAFLVTSAKASLRKVSELARWLRAI